jgi:hypothetical protein
MAAGERARLGVSGMIERERKTVDALVEAQQSARKRLLSIRIGDS